MQSEPVYGVLDRVNISILKVQDTFQIVSAKSQQHELSKVCFVQNINNFDGLRREFRLERREILDSMC